MSEETKTPLAMESGHWYHRDGTPCYEIIGKNGKPRPPRLKEAKALNLVPGVTSITGQVRKFGIELYGKRQTALSALTMPRLPEETDEDFVDRIIVESTEHAMLAAQTGTQCHAAIEQYIGRHAYDTKWTVHITQLRATLLQYGIDIFSGKPEHSFASPLDYGGKLDWHSDEMILDFKSKDTVGDKKQLAFDEHCWQLAAYAGGVGNMSARTRLLNVFVGIKDCEVRVHEWNEDDISRGWYAFLSLLEFWKLKNNWKNTNP